MTLFQRIKRWWKTRTAEGRKKMADDFLKHMEEIDQVVKDTPYKDPTWGNWVQEQNNAGSSNRGEEDSQREGREG